MDLTQCREKIDELDRQLVALFAERMETAAQVAAYKKEHGLPVLDAARERQKLRAVGVLAPEAFRDDTETLYRLMFELSRSYQHRLLDAPPARVEEIRKALDGTPQLFPARAAIACQGVEGAYSQLACERLFRTPDIFYFSNFVAVFAAVDKGLCRYGVVPLPAGTAGGRAPGHPGDLLARAGHWPVRPVFAVPSRCACRPLCQHGGGGAARGRVRKDGCCGAGLAVVRGALWAGYACGVGAGSGRQFHPLHLHLQRVGDLSGRGPDELDDDAAA